MTGAISSAIIGYSRNIQISSITKSLILSLTALLWACSGDDSSNSTNSERASQPTASVEAPSATAEPTSPPDSEATEDLSDIVSTIYNPPAEHPKAVNLPLQFVPTKGGKKLSVRVTLPADENGDPLPGPFPVIVTQSAYNTNLMSQIFMGLPGNLLLGVTDSFIVRRGYAQVAVDTLGTGASEGGWELISPDEQEGMADIIDWAHQQPWANGKLGVAGVSYMAITSLFAAQHRPDSIDAVFASLPMGDAMRGTVGIGGLLNALFMSTWLNITHTLATQNMSTMLLYPQYMSQLMATTQEHVDQVDGYFIPLVEQALDGAPLYNYDNPYWQIRSPIYGTNKIKAPTFILGALHDIFQRDEPLLYEILEDNDVDSRLVIFNGSHIVNFVVTHIGNEAVPPIDLLLLQWFDKHLKGWDTGIEEMPQVTQYVKNYPTPDTPEEFRNDSYATTTTWPHPEAAPERWFLHGDNTLTRSAPEQEETSPTMTNPEHPYGGAHNSNGLLTFELHINDGTDCSRSFEQWVLGIALPKSCFTNSDRVDQQRVIFETEPMEEDYYINGPIQADIWIDSTVTEAVVAVQIEEVSSRQSLPITNGQLLASGRAIDEERSRFIDGVMIQPYHYFTEETSQLLVPGEVVKLSVEVFPTSAIIRRGNKLRVSISPSNQAQGVLNFLRQTQAEGGITTIHISPEHPSSVVLPSVPTSALN